ncbi:hypothetical protein Ae201684P_004629 [Aphanomyces euteiches]|nr:hypothetical protein Ae201684P_004629 [Aphanomyces euteiches]KAH9153544.1 hypothetical protein AeRB84_004219 [Aphanomyces euteiches]
MATPVPSNDADAAITAYVRSSRKKMILFVLVALSAILIWYFLITPPPSFTEDPPNYNSDSCFACRLLDHTTSSGSNATCHGRGKCCPLSLFPTSPPMSVCANTPTCCCPQTSQRRGSIYYLTCPLGPTTECTCNYVNSLSESAHLGQLIYILILCGCGALLFLVMLMWSWCVAIKINRMEKLARVHLGSTAAL